MAASGLMDYLSSSLLSERLLPVAIWSRLAPMTLGRDDATAAGSAAMLGQRMVLDATALSAIEVVETLEGSAGDSTRGTLGVKVGWGC